MFSDLSHRRHVLAFLGLWPGASDATLRAGLSAVPPASRMALALSARPAGAVVLSLSAAPAGAVIPPPPGMPAARGGQRLHYRRFRIAAARPFVHMATGKREEITADRIGLWASAFDGFARAGTYPFIYPRHLTAGEQPDARHTLGYVVGHEQDGGDWYSIEQYVGDEAARVADANGRSVTIMADGADADGNRYPEYLHHLALTPRAALPEAGYVPALAASGAVVMAPVYVCDAGGCRAVPFASRVALAASAGAIVSRAALALAGDGGCSKWRDVEGEPVCFDGSPNPNRPAKAGTGMAPASRPMTEADHGTAREHARQARNAQRQADKYRGLSSGDDYYGRQANARDAEARGHRDALDRHLAGLSADDARPYRDAARDVDKPLPDKRETPAAPAADAGEPAAPSHEYHHDASGLTFTRSGDTVTVTGGGLGRNAAALRRAGFRDATEDVDADAPIVHAPKEKWEGPAEAVGNLDVPRAWDVPAKLGLRFKGKVGGGRQLVGG